MVEKTLTTQTTFLGGPHLRAAARDGGITLDFPATPSPRAGTKYPVRANPSLRHIPATVPPASEWRVFVFIVSSAGEQFAHANLRQSDPKVG